MKYKIKYTKKSARQNLIVHEVNAKPLIRTTTQWFHDFVSKGKKQSTCTRARVHEFRFVNEFLFSLHILCFSRFHNFYRLFYAIQRVLKLEMVKSGHTAEISVFYQRNGFWGKVFRTHPLCKWSTINRNGNAFLLIYLPSWIGELI